MDDHKAMRLALACARSVEGRTSPRPPVGAVVIRDEEVVGQGATAPPYGPHAETQAISQAGELARGATLYVTLEPCCIHVHTPPCTAAISAAGIHRVVVAMLDPNPRVSGQGISLLRAAGLEVELLANCPEVNEAEEINRPFAMFITHGRPYVTAKWAMTLDGKLASYAGDSKWISGPVARSWVHDLRDRVDAILVGSGTARRDNPQLTVRLKPDQQRWPRTPRPQPPLRAIMTASGELPPELLLLQPELAAGTYVITGEQCSGEQRQRLLSSGIQVLTVASNEEGEPDVRSALQVLGEHSCMHVLLEGGARLLGSAFDGQCIDHVAVFVASRLIGGQSAPSPIAGHGLASMAQALHLQDQRTQLIGADVLIEGEILSAEAPIQKNTGGQNKS